MSAIIATMPEFARKVNNFAVDATAGGLWISNTQYKAVVPASKRWFLIGGTLNRSASTTAVYSVYDSGDHLIYNLGSDTAAVGSTAYPRNDGWQGVVIMDPGEYVKITCGGTQGAGAYASCVVLEVDM